MKARPIKTMTIFGTRPEAIKMAPVVKALEKDERFNSIVVVTAQHREMLDQVLDLFGIKPHYDLNIMQHEQSLMDVVIRGMSGLDPVIRSEQPDIVLVHGDTLTTFIGSLVAFFHRVAVGHVEAGLRTWKRYNPFPEEMNRRLTGAIAELHFAPTWRARENLLRENVDPERIFVVGNTVVDALLSQVARDGEIKINGVPLSELEGKRIILLTTHRRENIGEPMRRIYLAVQRILESVPDTVVVFPVHKNPAVRDIATQVLGTNDRVYFIEPPDYATFAKLMAKSYFVMTDSGGIQEEAPALGKPVLVLRETTERPEGIAAGTCVQVGTDSETIVRKALELLTDKHAYEKMAKAVNPYGDGKASARILDAIAFAVGGIGERPSDFVPSS